MHLSGDSSVSCCNPQTIQQATGQFDEMANMAISNGEEVDYPKTSLAYNQAPPQEGNVLGAKNSSGEEKWVEVSLPEQKLRAWEGNHIVREFPISSGLWFSTPTGDYNIYWKLRYIRMKGGSRDLGTFYDLPNVPSTMFFYQGYALHGAYWHNNFGQPMSHGCVNEPFDQAAWLFEWAGPHIDPGQSSVRATADNPGSRVFIH